MSVSESPCWSVTKQRPPGHCYSANLIVLWWWYTATLVNKIKRQQLSKRGREKGERVREWERGWERLTEKGRRGERGRKGGESEGRDWQRGGGEESQAKRELLRWLLECTLAGVWFQHSKECNLLDRIAADIFCCNAVVTLQWTCARMTYFDLCFFRVSNLHNSMLSEPVRRTWQPLFWFFVRYVNCDVLVCRISLSDWQRGALCVAKGQMCCRRPGLRTHYVIIIIIIWKGEGG